MIQYYEDANLKIKAKGKLADFLPFDDRKHLIKETKAIIDDSLKTNLEQKLYRETFLILERAILQRKFKSKYVCNRTLLLINCAECGQRMATLECLECLDHFCQKCSDKVHSHPYNKNHKRVPLELYPDGKTHETPTPENGRMLMEGPSYEASAPMKITGVFWKKFEYFNFPVPASNDLFSTLQEHF